MNAHKIIETIKNFRSYNSTEKEINSYFKNLIPEIRNSKKINFGSYDNLKSVFKNKQFMPSELFSGLFSNLKLPYKNLWIEFQSSKRLQFSGDLRKHSLSRAILCEEINDDIISLHFFHYLENKWTFIPAELYIVPDSYEFNTYRYFSNEVEKPERIEALKYSDKRYIFKYLSDKKNFKFEPFEVIDSDGRKGVLSEMSQALFNSIGLDLCCLNFGLKILNCKNIVLSPNKSPEKLNKKRIKNNKEPISMFYDLMVKPFRKVSLNVRENKGSKDLVKFHWCMGHFKTYTKEKPLFGKIEGMFWWQEQTRGTPEKGTISKDYYLKVT